MLSSTRFFSLLLSLFQMLLLCLPRVALAEDPEEDPLSPAPLDSAVHLGELIAAWPLPKLPGRGGLVPELSLIYQQSSVDSGRGLGSGWVLNVSSIKVDTDLGTPNSDAEWNKDPDSKDTRYRMSLDGQALRYLNSSADGAVYTTESFEKKIRILRHDKPFTITLRDESGKPISQEMSSGFEVLTADGRRRIYSGDPSVAETSALAKPNLTPAFVSSWPLVYEIKPGGDAIAYHYRLDQGRSYLQEVSFASQRSRYVFHLQSRGQGPVSFINSFRQEGRLIYTGVVACLDNQAMRTWLFAYNQWPRQEFKSLGCETDRQSESAAAMLSSAAIQVPEASLMQRALTTLTSWFDELFTTNDGESLRNAVSSADDDVLHLTHIYRFGQKVGDPKDAGILREPTIQLSYHAWKSLGEAGPAISEFSGFASMSGFGLDKNAEMLDANVDGLLDLVVYDKAKAKNQVYENRGRQGFVKAGELTFHRTSTGKDFAPQLNEGGQNTRLLMSDLNGDGWDDVVEIDSSKKWNIFLNRKPWGASAYESASSRAQVDTNGILSDLLIDKSKFDDGRGMLLDINGDGLPDILYPALGTDAAVQFQAYLNTTQRGSEQITFVGRNFKFPFYSKDTNLLKESAYRFIDINHDGLVDLVKIVTLATGAKGLCLFENQGTASAAGSYLFRRDQPVAGVTCEDTWFRPIPDLDIDSSTGSLPETLNAMQLMDIDGNRAPDFVRVNTKTHELEYWLANDDGLEFSSKKTLPIDDRVRVSKNKYNSFVADLDGDGFEEIVLWDDTDNSKKKLWILDVNRQDGQDQHGVGLLRSVTMETGHTESLSYTSYSEQQSMLADTDPEAGRFALPIALTMLRQRITTAPVYGSPGSDGIQTNIQEYAYGHAYWDAEKAQFIGFDEARVFRPGTILDGQTIETATLERNDYDLTHRTPEERRYLAAMPKIEELIQLPWDFQREEDLNTFLKKSMGSLSGSGAAFFEGAYAANGQDQKVLKRTFNNFSLLDFPADPNIISTGAHNKPRYFVRFDSSSEGLCATDESDCSQVNGKTSQLTYDDDFRQIKQVDEWGKILGPKDQIIPAVGMETVLDYDSNSADLGLLENIKTRTVRSLPSRQLVATDVMSYHPTWGLPVTESSTIYVTDEDRARLPKVFSEKVPAKQTRLIKTSYDSDGPAGTGFGLVTEVSDAVGSLASFTYGEHSLFLIARSNALGQTLHTCYSARDCELSDQKASLPVSMDVALSLTPTGQLTRVKRDALGRPESLTDNLGKHLTFQYSRGTAIKPEQVELIIDDDVQKLRLSRSTSLIDSEGAVYARILDRSSAKAWVENHQILTRNGLRSRLGKPYESSLSYEKFLASENIGLNLPAGDTNSFDALGRIVREARIGNTEVAEYSYPIWGRKSTTTTTDGWNTTRSVIGRDLESPEAEIDEEGHLQKFQRNELGQIQSWQTEAEKEPRSYAYDSSGQLLSETVPGVRSTFYERDGRDRIIAIHRLSFDSNRPEITVQRKIYDEIDRLVRTSDDTGVISEYFYDHMIDPDGVKHELPGALLGSYSHDRNKRLDTQDVFVRDVGQRLIEQRSYYLDKEGTLQKKVEESWSYGADDRMLTHDFDEALQLDFHYDASGGMNSVEAKFKDGTPIPLFSEARWLPGSNLIQAQLGEEKLGGVWSYDPIQRWTLGRSLCQKPVINEGIMSCEGTESLHLDQWDRYANGLMRANNGTIGYGYNKRKELTQAGNEQWIISGGGQKTQGVERNNLNAERSVLLPQAKAQNLVFDDFGRVAEFDDMKATWSIEDQLLQTERKAQTLYYGYHADGERSYKEGDSVVYYPSPSYEIGAQSIVSQVLPGGIIVELNLDTKVYSYLILDASGTPIKRLDSQGRLLETWTRGAYGQLQQHQVLVAEQTSSNSPIAFGGFREDSETGFIMMGGRPYLPNLGSFVVPDAAFASELQNCSQQSFQTCNPYDYGANNPLTQF